MDIDPKLLGYVPLVMALVSMGKGMGLPSKYAAPVAVVVGMALAVGTLQQVTPEALIGGIAVGLSAAGLYSGVKAARQE